MEKDLIKLDKQNFFNERAKEAPTAMALFSKEVDNFKEKIGWKDLFNKDSLDAELNLVTNIKFHDLPYIFQKGFMHTFFIANDILVYVNPATHKKGGWEWMIIDPISETMAKSFLDSTQTDITVFKSYMSCEIDAFRTAFIMLEERIGAATHTPEDKINLN